MPDSASATEDSSTDGPTWVPELSTGLSGDTYLLEALEDHVEDISEASNPGIYVLELSTPATTDYERYVRLWMDKFDAVPDHLQSIAATDKLLYVGAAASVSERIREHLESPNRSTSVAEVFPIHSIRYIQWCDSPEQAFERESGVATDLTHNTTNTHVHCR